MDDVFETGIAGETVIHGGNSVMEAELRKIVCLYDGAIRYEDRLVGRIVDALRQGGLLDRTLLILTSDHGEAFNEHGGMVHYSVYEEVARVPLLVRWPGGTRTGRVDALVELVDLVPTVLDATGTPGDPALRGSSLAASANGDADPTAMTLGNRARFSLQLRQGTEKYIWSPRERRKQADDVHPEQELYDLASDPHERNSLATERPVRAAAARRALELRMARARETHDELSSGGRPRAVEIPEDERARLRALGYGE